MSDGMSEYVAVDLIFFNRKRPFILREIKLYFRETLANSMFIFGGTHVGQQCLLISLNSEESITICQRIIDLFVITY